MEHYHKVSPAFCAGLFFLFSATAFAQTPTPIPARTPFPGQQQAPVVARTPVPGVRPALTPVAVRTPFPGTASAARTPVPGTLPGVARTPFPGATPVPAVRTPTPAPRVTPTPRPIITSKSTAKEEEVNLDALPSSATMLAKPGAPPPAPVGAPPKKSAFISPFGGGKPSVNDEEPIRFKVYFDLNLYSRPGITNLGFDTFHTFLFLEGTPAPDMQFSFDVSASPRFYELDWQALPSLQIRAGKIWIPFDDTQIHDIYGGRVNVSRLELGTAFLPDIWTDLGVALKWVIRDVRDLNLVADVYVVNGFRSGGTDPVSPGSPYPSFADLPTSADNNQDKAVGGRLHGVFWNRFGLGASAYQGRWSDQTQPAYHVTMMEGDAQFRLPPTLSEVRLGIMSMKVTAPSGTFYRAGTYAEFGQYLTRMRTWKLLFRGGTMQMDDRVLDVNDQRIVGAMLIWRPSVIQLSLEHSNDLEKVSGKPNYSFTNLRMAIMF